MSSPLPLHGKDSSVIFWSIQLLIGFGPIEHMRIEKGDSSEQHCACIASPRWEISGAEHIPAGD